MRQGQQHRRGRGRNNNNHRKGHNPLSRSFESNGPDVKVRGTPAHIAEKYLSLARDALSAGDPVLAENYLQHAEHYNRIIMAYREQQMQQSGDSMNGARMRQGMSEGGDLDESQEDDIDDLGQSEQPSVGGFQQEQPRFHGSRGDDDRQPRHDGGRFRDRNDRHNRPDRQFDRQPDTRGDMRQQGRERGGDGGQPQMEGAPPARQEHGPRRRERFGPGNEQPEFLRRPVRRPRRDDLNGGDEEAVQDNREDGQQDKTTA